MEFKPRRDEPSTSTRKGSGERREPRYHVYIRLPFNRGDFVDPGTVNWNEAKSEALWAVLSDSSLGDVDWTNLAAQFDVTVDFLLQIANYLTERHTSQLRAHMLKAAAARGSNAPSPVPGAEPPGINQPPAAEVPRRSSSAAGRAPSALSVRRDTVTPLPKNEGDTIGTAAVGPATKIPLPIRPGSSRNPSASTAPVNQNLQIQPPSRPGTAPRLSDPRPRRLPYLRTPPAQQQQYQPQEEDDTERPPPSPVASTSSSSSTSSSESPVESRIIRRPPRFQSRDPRTGGGGGSKGNTAFGDDDDDDDDDDAEPAFLPLAQRQRSSTQQGTATATGSISSGADLGATLRGDVRDPTGRRRSGDAASQSQTSDSSVGSAAVVPRRPATAGAGISGVGAGGVRVAGGERRGRGGQLLSPRRAAELAGRGQSSAAANRGKVASREGSDGTPSMGSSFSDLDDASVTQSALEEALASRMQDGTIGSRMSVIGGTIGAIRSRYLPKPNRQ